MNMEEFIFRKNNNEYSKTIQPVQDYINQMSNYISKRKNIPLDQAESIVNK